MRTTLLGAAVLALVACASNEPNDDYLGGVTGTAAVGGGPVAGASGQAGGAAPPVGAAPMAGAGSMLGGSGGSGGNLAPGGAGGQGGATAPAAGSGGGGEGASGAGAGGMGGNAGQAGAGSGGAPMGGTTGGSTAGTVTVQFTTITYGGEYAPANYGAVWIEDASGKFIKTAKRWAGTTHASDLATWTMVSMGWGSIFGGGNMADMVDAVSSPTIRMHQAHMVTWNMKNAEKQLVADGEYTAVIEMTESRARDRNGPLLRIEFTKGPSPQMVMPPDEMNFKGISLSYTP
jgi:hypothetical protein